MRVAACVSPCRDHTEALGYPWPVIKPRTAHHRPDQASTSQVQNDALPTTMPAQTARPVDVRGRPGRLRFPSHERRAHVATRGADVEFVLVVVRKVRGLGRVRVRGSGRGIPCLAPMGAGILSGTGEQCSVCLADNRCVHVQQGLVVVDPGEDIAHLLRQHSAKFDDGLWQIAGLAATFDRFEQRERERQQGEERRPPTPDWIVELSIGVGARPIEVHVGGCYATGNLSGASPAIRCCPRRRDAGLHPLPTRY